MTTLVSMDRDTWIQAMRDKLNGIREPLPAAAFRPGKRRSRRFGRKYERLAAGPNLSARRRRLIADTRIEYNDAFAEAASYFTPAPDFKSRAVFRARKRLVGQSRDARDFGPEFYWAVAALLPPEIEDIHTLCGYDS
jgi:hypothetical protein